MKTALLKPVVLAVLSFAIPVGGAGAQQYQYQPAPDYYHNDTASGTIVGGGLGAVTGAIIGGSGNRGEGALIGAGIGAITGRILGKSKDAADQQQAAAGYAYTAQANAEADRLAVTNYDLIEMTRAGLSDEVIIGAVRQRGGRFDLSPQGLIQLKQYGVSDRVVATAQNYTGPSGAPATQIISPTPPPVYVERAPVFIEPVPVIRMHYGPRYYHHHRHPRSGGSLHFRF